MKKTIQQIKNEIKGEVRIRIAAIDAKNTLFYRNSVEIEGIWNILYPPSPIGWFSSNVMIY